MKAQDCFELLAPHSSDVVVVCALGQSANEWWNITKSDSAFYMHGAMGFASSFALGVAVSFPDVAVWVFDGDGGFAMNLGTVLTEAGSGPPNLKHFILDNHCYQTVGSSPMVGVDQVDYAALGQAAGISRAQRIRNTEDLEQSISQILAPGFQLIVLDIECENTPVIPPPQPFEGPEMKYRFGRSMESRFGIEVFGAEGY